MCAVRPEVFEVLLDHGARSDATDGEGRTALHILAEISASSKKLGAWGPIFRRLALSGQWTSALRVTNAYDLRRSFTFQVTDRPMEPSDTCDPNMLKLLWRFERNPGLRELFVETTALADRVEFVQLCIGLARLRLPVLLVLEILGYSHRHARLRLVLRWELARLVHLTPLARVQ